MTTDAPRPRRTSATTRKMMQKLALAVVGALGTALVAWASTPPVLEPPACPPAAPQHV